ncbi:hypothetical protein cyc_05685 [Cyclospora cayetanensis]|uniref:Uncharacterized protein n=1 Tax=Cyclospora cayetanensis TaxID=88456 RepID=A0A1D3DAB9_9EIME|nr:hypothetical protein cyc_05685 [Cyclospora cayetanensis]
MAVYLHSLDRTSVGDITGKAWPLEGSEHTDREIDALQLQATGICVYINSNECRSVGQLDMQQLLLEQPCLPKDSLNRYILCLPSPGTFSEAETAGAASESECLGKPSIGLEFCSSHHSIEAAEVASVSASVRLLKHMTLNFRPTPLTWLLNFVKDPAMHTDATDNDSAGSSGGSNIKSTTSSLTEFHETRTESTAQPHEFDLDTVAPITACSSVRSSPQASAPTRAVAVDHGAAARAFTDPLLRDLKLELQSVDFLWTTRGTDLQLATATLSAALVRLRLNRFSTKFAANVKDFSLNFVVPAYSKATAPLSSNQRTKRTPCSGDQLLQTVFEPPVEDSKRRTAHLEALHRRPVLMTTEIIGLVPGNSCAISSSLESVHPLSPRFSGLTSSLKVEVGTCRVVYIHPKFWRLFDWMIDDFVGTLTFSSHPSPTPREEDNAGKSGRCNGSRTLEETPLRPIQRSPSLEDLAINSARVLQSSRREEVVSSAAEGETDGGSTDEDMKNIGEDKKLWSVPNEGLRRIFLLADAGRKILGLPELLLQTQPSGTCKNNLEGLVLPKAVPFSSFHYEVRITSPRLLLPASCIPSCRGVVCWPPLTCSRDKDASGDSKFSNHGCSRETCRTCGVVGKSQAAGGANEREIECFLDNFTVSNSWSLSHRYGLVEAINVSFKGLRAFARVDSHFQVFSGSDSGIVQTPEQHEKQGATSTRSNAVCCCCTHPALSSSRFLRRNAARLLCPTTTTPDSADIQCQLDASSSPGRYLLGSVDLVVHMYRPALLRPASSWLRVEVGLLPLRLDIQTLSLLFDVIKNNVTANDPEVEATRLHSLSPAAKAVPQNKEVPGIKFDVLPAEAPFAPVSPRDIQQSPNVVPGSQLKASAVKPRDDSDVCAILQELQDHQTLQGLLEPQLDFIELLEEWGHETFLLELVAHGLHLAVCEAQLEKQITLLKARCSTFRRRIGELLRTQEPLRRSRETSMASDCSSSNKLTSRVSKCPAQQAQQNPFLLFHATRLRVQLRSLRLQRMEAEQVGLLLPAVVVANDWVPLSSKNEEVQTTQVVYTQTRIIPPVTGTFIGMRVGSSTLFCPEFASPFCVVFTDSSCPLGLLQQQLEPLVNSTRHAEADAIAAAVAAARGDYSLATLVNPEQQSARRVSDEHDLQHTHQEEHPLVTAFTVPWVDPLQLRDLKEDLTSEESGLVSPAVAHSATTALLGDTVLGTPRKLDTSARSSDFKRAASGEPVGLPEISRDYTVIFDSADSCSRVQQHPAQGKLPSVLPAVALSPHPEELKVFYKSASAIPVIPLSESSLLTIREQQNMPSEAKLQILQRLSHQRKHQRRQQRVSVSSWRPRCVLSLPLLTRIGAFFSHKEVQPSGMPSQTPSRSREAVYEDIAYSNSFTAVEDPRKINQSVKAATDHPFPAAPVADQEAAAVPQAFSIDEDLTCFGSKALAVCRSSFDSAKRFAAELRSRGRRMPLGKLQPRHAATDEEGWSSSDDSWERSSEGNRHYTNCQQLSSDSTSGLSTGPQKLECPPLQLSSLNAALHLSEASVLVPVDSRISSTSSVLLRGSVDLSRRADGVHDPMDPSETSEDAEIACTLYRQLRGCDSSGSGGTSWGCNIDSVLFTAPDNTGHPLQEQNSRGRDRINYLGRLEDRFSPGLRAVDFLLQHAAVTCLRNSSPLQQLDASTADLHRRRKLLERRYIRSLRRSGTRGGGGNSTAPLGATQGANFADEGLPHFLPNELRSSAALGQVAFFKSCEDPSTGQQAIPAAVSASASERSWGSFGMPQADKEPNISVEAPSFTSAVDEPGSIAEDSQNSVRAICSDLWAQLTCFVLPPADPCGWKAKILNDAAMGVSQGVASDSRSCADAQGSCCRCLIRDKNFSRAGARRTPPGQRCNCCCHHPQEYTAVHVGPCELEVSYQDCLLICRCAAEQTRQLEEQQQLQQMHERVLQRLLRRCTMLQRELLLRQRRWQQPSAGEWENQQPCSVQKTSFGDRTPRSTAEMEQLRLSLPRVKERTLTPNKYAVRAPKGLQPYPPQRHLFAGLPLVRVTLLNDHLDCLQAPLLQLLLTDCRLTRAFYVLPPPHAALRQQEKQQRCAVSIFESSLRLWALNPLAVAFEPVVESLPLSLVVREAPYSLMHWAYSTRCDDASSSLTLDWQGNSTRLQKNRPSCPQQHQHRHDPRFSRIVVPSKTKPPSSESINNSSRQSSKDEASSSSVAPVLFRFSKTAADQETYAFEHQQEHSARRDVPSLEHLSVKLLRQHQSPGKTESSSGSIQQQRTLLSPPQGLRAKKMDRIGDDTATQVTEAVAHGEQYMGISLSCPEGSAIEANLSPLLLQSVLGSRLSRLTSQSAAEHDDEHEAGPAFLSEQRQTLVNDRRGAPLRKPPSSSTEALLAAFTLRGSCMEKRHISDDNGHLDTETLYKSGLAMEPGVDGPEGSSKMTVSCPPSPARSKDFDPATHPLHSLGRPEQWDWLRPLEERALTQMRLSTGAVATVHVALQLADQVPGTYDPQYSMCDTAADEQMRQGGSGRLIEGAVGHCRRWRLRMPVPLDRVGVYIQPLTDTKTVPSTGSTTASLGVHKDVAPFVVCRLIADGGTKQLLVQSQVVLRNSCSLPLEVMLLHPQEAPSLGPQENKPRHTEVGNDSQLRLLLLKPGETTAVPVDRRLRVRPIQAGLTYSWSRDLSLGMLWQVVNEAQQHGVSGTGKDAFKRSLPKLDLLRCCPLQSNTGNCNKCEEICSPATAEQGLARELVQENLDKQRQCDYHMAVLYGIERLLHSSISCLQLKVSFEAPLRLASNIPFPVRYRVHCPLVLKAGQDPPDDSEGSLQLNNCQYVHSFPLAGVAFLSLSLAEDRWSSRIQIHPRPLQRLRPPAAAPTAAADGASGSLSTATGRRHSSADLVKLDESKCRNGGAAEEMPGGETIVEVECSDTSYRVSKLWIIFCETEGGIPCLLLHAPVWMVSYVPCALHRDSLTEAGWAMQAVSAAAAAVDLNRSLESRKPVPVPKFGISTLDGLANHFDGEIRLLDFNTSSIRVEAEGLGCSSFLDIWGDFPKNLQVSSRFSTAHDTLMSPRQAMQIPGGLSANFPSSSSKEACAGQSATDASYKGSQVSGNSKKGFLHGSVGGNPSLDLVATRMEAGIPLLRPVLLLTLAPMYTVTNHCSFPVRVRQARAGLYCSYEGATSKAVDFTLELEPQQTQPLVWQFAEGSRAIQAQGLMPTLCWLQHGCSRVFLDPRTDGAPETVWSAWSGYSPLCFPREEWCLRLPFAPVEFPLDVHKMHEDCSCSTIRGKASPVSYEDPAKFMGSRLQPHELQPLSSISAAEPYRQLSVLLRRGVSVESSTKSIHNHRRIPDQLDARLYASSGCSLRLETEEGPANSISLIIKEEDFKLRDAISISNDTPLPLLVRQCCHKSTPENDTCGAASSGSSSVVEKFALPEAATLGVDSVTTAVVELWGAAIQGNSTQQNFNRHDTDNSGQHVKSDLGNHGEQSDRSMHLLNMLLEAQQRAEQERTHHQKGVALSHSPTSVYISPAPQKEAIQLQLNRLSRLAEAIVAENAAEHDKKQAECMGSGPSNAGSCSRCTWCRFESAVAKELRRIEASNGTPSGDADSGPSMLWPLPQLVLPGETVLFAWDDYRNLPCIELSYFSRLQQSLMEDSSPTAKLASSSHSASVSSTVDLHYLDQPLRLQIAPAGEVLGVGVSHPPGGDIARQREGTISKHVSPPHSSREVPPPAAGTASGGRISSWAEDDTEQVHVSSEDVDIDSLLTLPRYFLLSVVHKELAMDCSSGCSSGMHGHVRPWAFASMCPFAAAVVGSYAPDRKSASVAPATVHSGSGQSESADSILPLRPIPEPPKFELRMKIPLLQLSVLSQAAITDPLSRQTFRLPEELLLVTFEGLSASYLRSPSHSAIDSMHSQAYYPVLLQRAPSMPSEAPAVTSSSLQVPLASESSDNQVQGSGGRRAVSQHAISPEQGNSQGALVDFMMQQRQPHNSTDEGDVVLVDKCILSLKPISIKTDLNSFYVASEALNCWRSAFAAATASVNLLDYAGSEGSPMASPTTLGGEQPKDIPDTSPTCCESACSTDSRSGPPEAKGMEYHYSMQSGLEWACKGSSHWHSPVLFFVSKPADANLGFAPSPMFLRPRLVRRSAPASKEDRRQQLKHQRRQLYIFRVLVIAETCVVLSFKADTGGNSSALRRSVVTLSSLEDARLQINGLHMTAQSLTEKLKDFQQQQQPQFHCSFPLLLQLQHCHRRPALSLRDIARVVGQFYQQQLFSHLSKVLVSVDVLGNPALSFAHLQAGVYALARQPLEAAEAGGDVFEGMIKGAEDFLKHTGYGFFGGISRMAGVASDSLGALACDEVYVHARKQQGRHKARNVEEGLQQGVEALGRALAGGFTGLVEEPVRGAAEGGLEGLLRGAGRGIAGFLVKPLTGVLDLAQKTAEAIKDASQIEGYQRPRRRLPRLLLGASRLLVAYDAEAAAAKAILTEAEGQNWSNLPVLYFALDRSLESLTVLTESHMLLFKVHARCPAELQFLAPLSCILAAGHCSMQSRSSKNTKNLKVSGSLTRERHVVVLQILRSGESGVCYQQLLYANERLQRHILQSLRQLMLQ